MQRIKGVNNEEKKKYFECIFIDDTRENFDTFCNSVDEFGKNNDMLAFKLKNLESDEFVLLQLIPKSQIKQIINHYSESDIQKVFQENLKEQ